MNFLGLINDPSRPFAWPDKQRTFSTLEMLDSCMGNAEKAERDMREAQRQEDRLMQGDPRQVKLRGEITRLRCEVDHWRGYVEHYKAEAQKEFLAKENATRNERTGT